MMDFFDWSFGNVAEFLNKICTLDSVLYVLAFLVSIPLALLLVAFVIRYDS